MLQRSLQQFTYKLHRRRLYISSPFTIFTTCFALSIMVKRGGGTT